MNRSGVSRTLFAGLAAGLLLIGAAFTVAHPAAAHPATAHPAAAHPATVYPDAVRATITTEANLRAEPHTGAAVWTVLPAGAPVAVVCWAQGEPTYGTDRDGSMWLYLTRGGWVHSHLVSPVDVRQCSAGTAHHLPVVPFENCAAAIAAGAAPVYRGEPGFGPHLDRDRDGIGCEWTD